MTVIYETSRPRYIVQESRDGGAWIAKTGFEWDRDAKTEADSLQEIFPSNEYRVIDTAQEEK